MQIRDNRPLEQPLPIRKGDPQADRLMPDKDTAETLPLDAMRSRVRDLLEPTAWRYWTDFLFHISLAWAAFAVTVCARLGSPLQIAAYLVTIFALYRSVIFIHELTHLNRARFNAFRWTWNLLCGMPVLLPSFTYSGVHNEHHKKRVYGTADDGEYYPFASRSPLGIIGFLALNAVIPALLAIRFVLLTPCGWISPRLHRLLWRHASSMTIDAAYQRTPSDRDESDWQLQELLAFVYGASAIALACLGILAWQVLAVWYVAMAGGLTINAIRTLAAHRYRNQPGRAMSISEQFLDSSDIPGFGYLTELWAPIGLRYHATHHLFPSMPYHNLGTAYRRLSQAFPTVYTQATRRGLLRAFGELWQASRASKHGLATSARTIDPAEHGSKLG